MQFEFELPTKLNMVKFYIFLVLTVLTISVCALNQVEVQLIFMKESEKCRREVGAVTSDINDIIEKKPPANDKAKCLRACLMKQFDVMNADGKLNKASSSNYIKALTNENAEHMKLADEIFGACENLAVSNNQCEAAAQYEQCIQKEATARGIKS